MTAAGGPAPWDGAAAFTCEPLLTADDLPALERALTAAGLPAGDLGEPGRRFFRFLDAYGAELGYAGLEDLADGTVLLRSLVVDPARRGQGLGRRMADAALTRAGGEAWLLTTDAASFFAGLGFFEVPRNAAPESLRRTRQFSDLCPAAAIVMRRPAPPRG